MGSFCQKHLMFQGQLWQLFQRQLWVMTLKGDAKFKEKLTCNLNNDLENLVEFNVSSRESGNLYFDGLLLSKAYKDLDEKVQKSYVS